MNPVGMFLFYFLCIVGLGDVGKFWFVRRKLRRGAIYGPGVLVLGDRITIRNISLFDVDIVRFPLGTMLYSAHLLADCTIENCRFQNLTICGTPDTVQLLLDAIPERVDAIDAEAVVC